MRFVITNLIARSKTKEDRATLRRYVREFGAPHQNGEAKGGAPFPGAATAAMLEAPVAEAPAGLAEEAAGSPPAAAEAPPPTAERHVRVVEADPHKTMERAAELPKDVVMEPELRRRPHVARPSDIFFSQSLTAPTTPDLGAGASVAFRFTMQGRVVSGVQLSLMLMSRNMQSATVHAFSNAAGEVAIPFNPMFWVPFAAIVEPPDAWGFVIRSPAAAQVVDLLPLPRTGPVGWWQRISGVCDFSLERGAGIRVGVVDTGAGPHPALSHVVGVGSFVDGQFTPGAAASHDIQRHGTHVSGIIGARPPADSGQFGGIAPGVELFVVRVYPDTGVEASANQGDIAAAIDHLVSEHSVDIINLSLGGPPSIIEQDAVAAAFNSGTLCICSAGNDFGQAIAYPAAYPQAVSVSALGLVGASPPGSAAAESRPYVMDRYSPLGLYLANFSNIGWQMGCTAGGEGIISTLPLRDGATGAPYGDMNGTSLASPLVAGALAVTLSKDETFKKLPRDATRAAYARSVLTSAAVPIGLHPGYQGAGVARAIVGRVG